MTDTRALRVELHKLKDTAEELVQSTKRALEALDGPASVQIPGQGRLTFSMLADLWAESKHLPGVCALIEETAAHPDELVTYSQVLQRSGLTEKKQANDHARLTRNAIKLFGYATWPLEARQGGLNSAGRAEMRYRMPREVSEWFYLIVQGGG